MSDRAHHVRSFWVWIFLLSVLLPGSAAAQPDRTKVILRWQDGRDEPVPQRAAALGGREVAGYGSYRVISMPSQAVAQLPEKLRGTGLAFTVREDFDVLFLPGGSIDTRRGIDAAIPPSQLLSGYPRGTAGLYVVQLIGPSVPAWMARLAAAGAKVVTAVPQNGYLVGATDDSAAAIQGLPFVQWVSPYHPLHKGLPPDLAGGERDVEVVIAGIDGAEEVLAELLRLDPGARALTSYANRTVVGARLTGPEVARLLADGRVLGIGSKPELRPSDERQAMAVSSNLTNQGNEPTRPPGGYETWLHTLCPYCDSLSEEGFSVGVADSGVDGGRLPGPRHPDLSDPSTRLRFGRDFTNSASGHQDLYGHGTMVAGVVAGDASTGARDENGSGFLMGMGIAPTAGIFSTKIFTDTGGSAPWLVHDWAPDATDAGVYIQNHSLNDRREALFGRYTLQSEQYDAAVRDSNGDLSGGEPITLVVSSGNTAPTIKLTRPPATAKNVIAVGGAENFRNPPDQPSCLGTQSRGFMNIMSTSAHGTLVPHQSSPWSTYIKPDLVAVGANVASPRTTMTLTPPAAPCVQSFEGQPYVVESGTSLAAPVAAGAALIASRVYSEFVSPGAPDPALASPALLKAMLIGSARTMEGGKDYTASGSGATIGPRPNDVQGFGLVDITDLVNPAVTKSYVNQDYTFTLSGEASWNGIYFRRDPSRPVRVALTWTDAPAPGRTTFPANAQEPETAPLMNDLNLLVDNPYSRLAFGERSACPVHYLGNNTKAGDVSLALSCTEMPEVGADFVNNAELVLVPPSAGHSLFRVQVSPFLIREQAIFHPDPDVKNQDFALYISNASPRGDLDHEGKTDLVWRHSQDARPAFWPAGTTTGAFYLEPVDQPWRIEAVGDFDRDGSDDLVIRHPTTGETRIRRMNKTAHRDTIPLAATTAPGWDPNWTVQGAGDFNADGNLDLVWRNYGTGADSGKIRIGYLYDVGGTVEHTPVEVTTPVGDLSWHIEGVADFDSDGDPDLLWHHYGHFGVALWSMQNGQLASSRLLEAVVNRGQWHAGAVGDFNQDGFNDVVWRSQTGGSNVVWYGDGRGNLPRPSQPNQPSWGTLPSVSDLSWEIVGPR